MAIWVAPKYGARHDLRIKVMQHHGDRMDPGDLAVVALRPGVRIVAGQLAASDLRAIERWVDLNWPAILDHWEEKIDGAELVQRLRRLP